MMLFHYEKTRKHQAIRIAISILMLPLMLYGFRYVAINEPNFEEIYAIAVAGAVAVAVLLTGIMVWFWKSKEKFEIYVTEDEFYSHHPVFKEWCFCVDPKEIVEIKHHLSVGTGSMTHIYAYLRSQERLQICQNYPFSRRGLYDALRKANPCIAFPENAYVFNFHKKQ